MPNEEQEPEVLKKPSSVKDKLLTKLDDVTKFYEAFAGRETFNPFIYIYNNVLPLRKKVEALTGKEPAASLSKLIAEVDALKTEEPVVCKPSEIRK